MNTYWSKKRIENYLIDQVKESIKNDCGIAIKGYSQAAREEQRFGGFYSIPRMLFPEIDSLGSYITGEPLSTSRNIKIYLQIILSKINPKYGEFAGFIVLVLRHGLLHQHSPKNFKYKSKFSGLAINLASPNNPISVERLHHLQFSGRYLQISVNCLYNDLLDSFDYLLEYLFEKNNKQNFVKSINKQTKCLTKNFCLKHNKKYICQKDFNFLKLI